MKKIYAFFLTLMVFFIGELCVKADYVKPQSIKKPEKYNGEYTCQYWFNYNDIDYYLYIYLETDDYNNDGVTDYYFSQNGAEFWDVTNMKSYKITGQFNEVYGAVSFYDCPFIYYETSLMSSPDKFQFFSAEEKKYEIGTKLRDAKEISKKFENYTGEFSNYSYISKEGYCYISSSSSTEIYISRLISPSHYDIPSGYTQYTDPTKNPEKKFFTRDACMKKAMISENPNKGVCYGYDVYKAKENNFNYGNVGLWLKEDVDIKNISGYDYIIKAPLDAKNYDECLVAASYSNDDSKGTCYICEKVDVNTKKDCKYRADNYGYACYICNSTSPKAYGLWTNDVSKDSYCKENFLSPLENSEDACIEEGKKYSIKNGGSGEYRPPANGSVKSCGNGILKEIPSRITKITSTIVMIIQIIVPLVMIIMGMIDFAKATVSQKEDEINKGKKVFFTRLITALLVFLIILIVKILVGFINDATNNSNIVSCIDCFISDKCQ